MRARRVAAAASALLVVAPGAHAAPRARAFTPALGVSPARVPRGGFLTFAGDGWPASVPVRLAVGRTAAAGVTVARVVANDRGQFVFRLKVGRLAPLGPQVALACARACRLTARTAFRVTKLAAAARWPHDSAVMK